MEGKTGFIQLGDVIDRADHSELACEILRQLIIDAPGNVFVLLGNHEQFVIEDEYDNWYLNENRNAVVDGRKTPAEWSRHHLRFMPTMDVDDLERSRLVFEAYKESVQLLFLTQAAAQQKALNIAHGLSEDSIGRILSSGWSPYNDVSKVARVYSKKGRSFPGGLVSIVIGETLFHHAEPNQNLGNPRVKCRGRKASDGSTMSMGIQPASLPTLTCFGAVGPRMVQPSTVPRHRNA